MNLTQLKLRDKLVCKLADGDGSEYVVLIENVINESTIMTDLPIVHSGKVRFRLNTNLDFVYTNNQGIYYFQGSVAEFSVDSNFMLIKKIGKGGLVQRRNYFRLEMNNTCQLRLFADFFCSAKKIDHCAIDNVSAGGIKIMTNSQNYQPGELYHIAIDAFAPLKSVWAEVLSVEPISSGKNVAYLNYVSLHFVFLKSKETDELVRQLMNKQREMFRTSSSSEWL